MTYHIKKRKVNRKWMFKIIQAQQEKLNELFETLVKQRKELLMTEQKLLRMTPGTRDLTQSEVQPVKDPRIIKVVGESTHEK